MNKIGVLGCGWLGMPLAKELITTGFKVNGSTTSVEKEKQMIELGIRTFILNLNNLNNDLQEFLDVDVLILSIPPRLKNHNETINDLIAKIEHSKIKKVIYTSSISVYGNKTGLITEKTETSPTRNTSKQIIEIEDLLVNNKTFNTTILRLGGLIGNKRHPAYHLTGKLIQFPNETINLIHLEDCISAIKKLIALNVSNEIFNLVNPNHPEKGAYYVQCCKKLKLPLPILGKENKSEIKNISSEKIIKRLNLNFLNNLEL